MWSNDVLVCVYACVYMAICLEYECRAERCCDSKAHELVMGAEHIEQWNAEQETFLECIVSGSAIKAEQVQHNHACGACLHMMNNLLTRESSAAVSAPCASSSLQSFASS